MRRRSLGRTRPDRTQEIGVKRGKGFNGGKRAEGANPPPPPPLNTNLDGALVIAWRLRFSRSHYHKI